MNSCVNSVTSLPMCCVQFSTKWNEFAFRSDPAMHSKSAVVGVALRGRGADAVARRISFMLARTASVAVLALKPQYALVQKNGGSNSDASSRLE